jgi:SPP1 family predicted phage head-tail adaptor
MRAGPARHRFRILESQSEKAPGGSRIETWMDIGGIWGEVSIPNGRTLAVADQLQAVVDAEIHTRYRSNIVAGMRLVRGIKTYQVQAALPNNNQSMLRLLCSTVLNFKGKTL